MPPLNQLCYDGKREEVRSALAHGGNVNDKDSIGHTALMWAVINGHNSIVKLLLDQPGVRINEKSIRGNTALHFAVLCNNPEGARMLLLHPDINSANSTDDNGDTALMMAIRWRKKEVLLELVKHQSISLDMPEGVFDER